MSLKFYADKNRSIIKRDKLRALPNDYFGAYTIKAGFIRSCAKKAISANCAGIPTERMIRK